MFDFRPLRSRDFRHLAAAYLINEFGTWAGEIALTIVVYARTHSPLVTAGLFLTLRFLPALIAPLLTTRAEAMRVRTVIPALYVLEGALYVAIAVLVTHRASIPALLALAALDGMFAIAAKTLTRSATARGLLEQDMLREGNAIVNIGWMASTACAPVIAGGLVAWKGASSALLVDAATFFIAAVSIATGPGIQIESDQDAGFMGRLRSGLAVIRRPGPIRRLMFALSLVMLLSAVPLPIEVVFAKHTLHTGDSGYGLLISSWGVGMVAGGAIFAVAGSLRLTHVFVVGMLIVAMGYGVLAGAPTLAAACVGSIIGGVGNGAGWVAAVTALQERIPLPRQSAIMAVLEGANQVMPALGFVVGGAVTAAWSPRVAYAIAAVGVALLMLVFIRRPIDQIELRPIDQIELRRPGTDAGASAGLAVEESTEMNRSLQVSTVTLG